MPYYSFPNHLSTVKKKKSSELKVISRSYLFQQSLSEFLKNADQTIPENFRPENLKHNIICTLCIILMLYLFCVFNFSSQNFVSEVDGNSSRILVGMATCTILLSKTAGCCCAKSQKVLHITFLIFPACFYIPIIFSNLNSNCTNVLDLETSRNKLKKAFCFKNCSDLLWCEKIILVISKILQIVGLRP